MAMTTGGSVPSAGTPDAHYPAPTPHAANVSHQRYEAPTSGAGVGAGYDGAGTDFNEGREGAAVNGMKGDGAATPAKNHSIGSGTDPSALDQAVMGDENSQFGSEHDTAARTMGGGSPTALDELPGLTQGTGYGSVDTPTVSPNKGLQPGATGTGAKGTGNQNAGYNRRVIGGSGNSSGGFKSV